LILWRRAHDLDPEVAQERARNRYVEQIMRRIGVENVFAGSD